MILMSECHCEEGKLRTRVSDRPDEGNALGVALASSNVPAG